MTALKVIALVLLSLFLLGRIRAGGIVEWSADGLEVWARLGAARFRVFPLREKEKKPKKAKKKEKKEEKPAEAEEQKKGGPLDLARQYLPLIGEAAGALKRRIRIDVLDLSFTAGGTDAAKTALLFGYSNAAVGMIWPIFEQNFEIKDYHIHTGVDFLAKAPAVYIKASISARIGQLLSFAAIYGCKFIKTYLGGKKTAKAPQAARKG